LRENQESITKFVTLLLDTYFIIIPTSLWSMKTTRTSSRKRQHVNITLAEDVSFRFKSSGLDRWEFIHNALPEMGLSEIDTSTFFLGKPIAFPFIISSMTGGYAGAERINRQLAEICVEKKIALGVGSQRQVLEDDRYLRSFSIVRSVAPSIPIFGNIGATEIAKLKDASPVLRMIELIHADGFAIHLNPLQEVLQTEGDKNFRGVLKGIELLKKAVSIPLIVKEVGAGISEHVARQLINIGITIIDVAGAGGTSWAGVEILRKMKENKQRRSRHNEIFWDWGIPTGDAIRAVSKLKTTFQGLQIIASGGITNGLEIAKSIALKSDYAAAARPILKALVQGGVKAVINLVDEWDQELRYVMFLTGSRSLSELQKQELVERV
jgi:isopentenyl-diphosphate delta-isomerase